MRVEATASSLTSVSLIYSPVRFSATGRLSFHFKPIAHPRRSAGCECVAAQRLQRFVIVWRMIEASMGIPKITFQRQPLIGAANRDLCLRTVVEDKRDWGTVRRVTTTKPPASRFRDGERTGDEYSTPWPPEDRPRDPGPDSTHEPGQPAVGSSAHDRSTRSPQLQCAESCSTPGTAVAASPRCTFLRLIRGQNRSVTNLAAESQAVVRFYNKRGTTERWIKEGKVRRTSPSTG